MGHCAVSTARQTACCSTSLCRGYNRSCCAKESCLSVRSVILTVVSAPTARLLKARLKSFTRYLPGLGSSSESLGDYVKCNRPAESSVDKKLDRAVTTPPFRTSLQQILQQDSLLLLRCFHARVNEGRTAGCHWLCRALIAWNRNILVLSHVHAGE